MIVEGRLEIVGVLPCFTPRFDPGAQLGDHRVEINGAFGGSIMIPIRRHGVNLVRAPQHQRRSRPR